MNVAKMRHQRERIDAAEANLEHARWLARMTPEHRAKHTGPFGGMACMTCVAIGFENFAKQIEQQRANRRLP
jgi:hypothetical protein